MSPESAAVQELLDPEFLAAVQHLRIVARRVARGGRHAEQRSRDLGSGIEYRDHRPYVPGDDLRAVDWNIYARLRRLFLKLFEELEDLPVHILLDNSRSAFHDTPPRVAAGRKCALALAAIALGQHDRVGLYTFSDDLGVAVPPVAGRGRVLTVARALAALAPGGGTDLQGSLRRFAALHRRPGLVVVISDLLDPGGLDAVTNALRMVRHRLLVVQLVRSVDADPRPGGDVELVDCETGETRAVSPTPALLHAYRRAHARFQEGLSTHLARRAAGLLKLDVDGDVLAQLATLFERGRLRV